MKNGTGLLVQTAVERINHKNPNIDEKFYFSKVKLSIISPWRVLRMAQRTRSGAEDYLVKVIERRKRVFCND
jgi:transposase